MTENVMDFVTVLKSYPEGVSYASVMLSATNTCRMFVFLFELKGLLLI